MTRRLIPLSGRGPLRTLFAITSMPVGGAETLLVNLIRRLDRSRFEPEVCCLKDRGPLGEELAREIPVHHGIVSSKHSPSNLMRLARLFRERQIDAVITVGAGDKMFWGRLAGWWTGVPVILSALHSTGWPDGVGRLNRLLTPITDGFIGVAREHGRYLVETERFPAAKVHVIQNGVNVDRFRPRPESRRAIREALGISPAAPVCGIVAALRPEKNHTLFLKAAAIARRECPDAQFLIVGDGPERPGLELFTRDAGLTDCVHFLGTRSDIPDVLAACDVFGLTSHNEANPVSILEAMAVGLPVVSTRVGSVAESVGDGETGFLADPGDANQIASHWLRLFQSPDLARLFGQAGRDRVVQHWSLERMVEGYETLIETVYESKVSSRPVVTSRDSARCRV